ncbi:MAG: EAL domain-containing protein [Rhodomicrobium sp.]|nr:EAL domain-containing protein [Rhodomicrobium sp.]
MIAMLWFGIWYQIHGEFDGVRKSARQDLQNFARIFEEHIVRTVRELDKALLIARRRYLKARETMSYEDAIGQLLPEPDLLSDLSFQMAAIDRNGILRASTIGKHPPEPIDLKDREHFKVHTGQRPDIPFISKPVLGRKSGRWSVQLTRRIEGPGGSFDGVFVVSMDPALFGRFYDSIDFGKNGMVIFAGDDGFVRVVSGTDSLKLGDEIKNTDLLRDAGNGNGVYVGDMDKSGQKRMYALHQLPGQPLFLAVGISPDEIFASARSNQTRYIVAGAAITIILLLAVAASIRHHMTIDRMARYDELTGLANRALFRERIENAISELPRGNGFTVFLVDVDKFKSANDTFGHTFGDKLLCGVAERLRKAARRSDLVARLGGDEFAIVMKDLKNSEEIVARADKFLTVLREPLTIDGQRIVVTASLGSSTALDRSTEPEEILKNADLALYEAKSEGRDRYRAFKPEMARKFAEKRKLEEDLRDAVEQNQLQLHYQIINSLRDDYVCSFEALLRWNHPSRGWISPMDFIPIAEESGLIIPIGEWVLREACVQATAFKADKRIAVNLSPVQFRDPELLSKVINALKYSGLAPQRLELEITESLMMQANPDIIETIKQIRSLGVKIAMDDFGTGYSSFGYLCNFEFDKIKIDRSFVKGLDERNNYAAIIRAIVSLAESLKVRTTAEGVETLKQLEILKSIGCTEAQGYLFSPPKPIELLSEYTDFTPAVALREVSSNGDGKDLSAVRKQRLI